MLDAMAILVLALFASASASGAEPTVDLEGPNTPENIGANAPQNSDAMFLPSGGTTQPDSEMEAYAGASGSADSIDSRYEYYRDSSGDVILRSTSETTVERDSLRYVAHSETAIARDALGTEELAVRSIELAKDLTESWSVAGVLGLAQTNLRQSSLIGSIRTEADLLSSSICATLSRAAVTSGTAPIRNHIMMTDFGLAASRTLLGNLSLNLDLHRAMYADHNGSVSIQAAPQYSFDWLGGSHAVGYRFHYLSFARPMDGGGYSPQLLLSHEGFWNISYDSPRYYGSLQLSAGRQYQRVRTAGLHHLSGSGDATVGMHLTDKLLVELNASGGNYGLELPSAGWSYLSTALRVKFLF